MPTKPKALKPENAQPLIAVMSGGAETYFVFDGLPRHTGEVLPREGANIGVMEEQGLVRTLSRDARTLTETCECGRVFIDKDHLKAHISRGHDDGKMTSRFMPMGAELIPVEKQEAELACPPEAHFDKDEEGDGQIVRMWHPDTKRIMPKRQRGKGAWSNVSRAEEV